MSLTTEHRGYGLPNAGEAVGVDGAKISEDLAIFQAALIAIDVDVHDLFVALAGKSDTGHLHAIADVTGLQTALNAKAATTHTHNLDDIDNVSGAAAAPTTGNYVLVKTALGWVPQQVASLLGSHSHTASDITDLATVLAAYATTASLSSYATQTYVGEQIDAIFTVSTSDPSGGSDGDVWFKVAS
ncbi:MAG: hypothetical protein KKB37_11365 [Alphaproteobacteria bacterium]|nr:hypothetical protein [Alphaproteobacteria bacterium]